MKNLFILYLLISTSYCAASSSADALVAKGLKLQQEAEQSIVTVKPKGEYAQIDVASSNEVVEFLLLDKPASQTKKRELARKVEANLGYYNPMAILGLANYYLKEGSLEKYALYGRFALFRAIVDVKLAKDSSLDDVVPIMLAKFGDLYQQKNLDGHWNREDCKKALVAATKQIIQMDRTIPRNYDQRWPSLHSMGAFTNQPLVKLTPAERESIIEQERQYFIEAAREAGVIIH